MEKYTWIALGIFLVSVWCAMFGLQMVAYFVAFLSLIYWLWMRDNHKIEIKQGCEA